MTTSLPTTRLGWTGMHLTRVGFGAWAIGGGGWAFGWGSQDDADSVAAIRHAVRPASTGSTPRPFMAWGTPRRSWRRAARVAGGRASLRVHQVRADPGPGRPFCRAAAGRRPASSETRSRPPSAGWASSVSTCISSTGRTRSARRSKRLGSARRPQARGQGARGGAFQPQRRTSSSRPSRSAHVDAFSRRSLIHRDAAADVIPWVPRARDRRDRLQPDAIGTPDRRVHRERSDAHGAGRLARRYPEFPEPALSPNLALPDALRPIAARHGVSLAAVAVAWTLALPGVTGAIVGARARAGRRLDRRREPDARRRRPGRDRRRRAPHRRGSSRAGLPPSRRAA